MGHPEFTFMLARQRTGTNALRSVLQSNPDIFCFDEVFKIEDRHSSSEAKRVSNYFTFLEQYCAGDITRAYPDQVEPLFDAYLAYLRGLADKRLKVVDVKYNSTHHITGTWRAVAEPTLFDLIKARELSVLQLCRRNYLRCLLSHLKAWESKQYYEYEQPAPPDRRIVVYADWALGQFERWRLEDELVATAAVGIDEVEEDGFVMNRFYNPCFLSNDSYGFHEEEEGVDERRPWTPEEWAECLSQESWELLEACLGAVENQA